MFRTRTSDAARTESGPPGSAVAPSAEAGFTLAALIVFMTLLAIFVAYTVPDQWSLVMQRERERHTIWQMKQIAGAVLRFQQKHQVLPTSLKQLYDARQPRVIRGLAETPCALTGKDDWILVPPQAVTVAGMPTTGAGGGGPTGGGVPTTTIMDGRSAIVVPVTDPRVAQQASGGGSSSGAVGIAPGQISKLNPALSPDDYKDGPFVGVRPRKKGKSMLKLNEAEDYGQWVYTYQDVYSERALRLNALYKK